MVCFRGFARFLGAQMASCLASDQVNIQIIEYIDNHLANSGFQAYGWAL